MPFRSFPSGWASHSYMPAILYLYADKTAASVGRYLQDDASCFPTGSVHLFRIMSSNERLDLEYKSAVGADSVGVPLIALETGQPCLDSLLPQQLINPTQSFFVACWFGVEKSNFDSFLGSVIRVFRESSTLKSARPRLALYVGVPASKMSAELQSSLRICRETVRAACGWDLLRTVVVSTDHASDGKLLAWPESVVFQIRWWLGASLCGLSRVPDAIGDELLGSFWPVCDPTADTWPSHFSAIGTTCIPLFAKDRVRQSWMRSAFCRVMNTSIIPTTQQIVMNPLANLVAKLVVGFGDSAKALVKGKAVSIPGEPLSVGAKDKITAESLPFRIKKMELWLAKWKETCSSNLIQMVTDCRKSITGDSHSGTDGVSDVLRKQVRDRLDLFTLGIFGEESRRFSVPVAKGLRETLRAHIAELDKTHAGLAADSCGSGKWKTLRYPTVSECCVDITTAFDKHKAVILKWPGSRLMKWLCPIIGVPFLLGIICLVWPCSDGFVALMKSWVSAMEFFALGVAGGLLAFLVWSRIRRERLELLRGDVQTAFNGIHQFYQERAEHLVRFQLSRLRRTAAGILHDRVNQWHAISGQIQWLGKTSGKSDEDERLTEMMSPFADQFEKAIEEYWSATAQHLADNVPATEVWRQYFISPFENCVDTKIEQPSIWLDMQFIVAKLAPVPFPCTMAPFHFPRGAINFAVVPAGISVRLAGVGMANTNPEGSRFFEAPGVTDRVFKLTYRTCTFDQFNFSETRQ